MVWNNDYRLMEWSNLKGGHTFTYFLLIMLPYPLINMFLFSAPVYFSFRIKDRIYFILAMVALIMAEYIVYLLFTSESHIDIRGVCNGIITLVFFILFFFKTIKSIFRKESSVSY